MAISIARALSFLLLSTTAAAAAFITSPTSVSTKRSVTFAVVNPFTLQRQPTSLAAAIGEDLLLSPSLLLADGGGGIDGSIIAVIIVLLVGITGAVISKQLNTILDTQVDDYLEIVKRQDVDKYNELVAARKDGQLDRPDFVSDVFSVATTGDEKEKKELLFMLSKASSGDAIEKLRPQLEKRLGSSLEDYITDVGRYGFNEVISDTDRELAAILKAALNF